MLISPTSTFNSCGSSSIEALRSTLPTRVTRGSSRILNSGPSMSLRSRRSSSCCSASSTIVRSLRTRKSLPSLPTRTCEKKIGPFESSLMSNAAIARIGDANTSRPVAMMMSNERLATARQPRRRTGSMYITARRPSGRANKRSAEMSTRPDVSSTWQPISISSRASRFATGVSIALVAMITPVAPSDCTISGASRHDPSTRTGEIPGVGSPHSRRPSTW